MASRRHDFHRVERPFSQSPEEAIDALLPQDVPLTADAVDAATAAEEGHSAHRAVLISEEMPPQTGIAEELRRNAYEVILLHPDAASGDTVTALPQRLLVFEVQRERNWVWPLLSALRLHADTTLAPKRIVMVGPADPDLRVRALIEGALEYVTLPLDSRRFAQQLAGATGPAPEQQLRRAAQQRALTELARAERKALHQPRPSAGSAPAEPRDRPRPQDRSVPSAPAVSEDTLDRLSAGLRRTLAAVSVTSSLSGAAALLGVTASRVSTQVGAAAKRMELSREELVALARGGGLIGPEDSGRIQLSGELHEAIAAGQLYLDYQPILSIPDRHLWGTEALLRWRHPVRHPLMPREFLGFAGAAIWPVTEFVVNGACSQLLEWDQRFGHQDLKVIVNIAANQLVDPMLISILRAALQGHSLDPSRLVLDVPASQFSIRAARVVDAIARVRGTGVQIAADDFAAPAAMLRSRMTAPPMDILRIHPSLIAGLGHAAAERAIVTASVGLAASLGIRLHAKGVETARQLDALSTLGCRYAQGKYLAPPMLPNEIAAGSVDG